MSTSSTAVQPFQPSPEQEKIIKHRQAHLQVIACAGAGKTEAISRRVAELIVEGVEPQSIIAFTFTERAAAAMKARILLRVEERLGAGVVDRLGPMYIGTIHAYCFRLLQDHVPQYANFDVLDDHRHAALLSREFKRLKLNEIGDQHWRPIGDFMRNADVIENELIDDTKIGRTAFGRCYRDYCAMLRRYRFLTYGRLITSAVEALETPQIFEHVHGPLRHLIVDEYQDINPAQERLIELLAKPPVTLCVVGDDDQAIYQWRGSDVGNILNFARRYKPASTLSLSTNRRSRPRIITAANAFAKSINPRLPKSMHKKREAAGRELFCWSAETPDQEAERITDTVEQLVLRGYRYRDIGILLRSVRTSSPPILGALRQRGIPVHCAGRTGLFLQPEPQVLGKTYALLSKNGWKTEKYGQPAPVTLPALVKEYAEVFDLSPTAAVKLRKRLEDWSQLASSEDDPANLVRDYYQLLRHLGVHVWDLENPVLSARMGTLARFSELLADFEHVRRRARWVEEDGAQVYRGGQSRGPWYYRSLFNYLQYYALEAYEDFEGEDTFETDAVDVLTVHQAKGLEWPVVFLPALVDARFPSSKAGQPQNWLLPKSVFGAGAQHRYEGSETDERRLFYVAMTRARDMLYLSGFRRIKNRKSPSIFLTEVAGGDPPDASSLPLAEPYAAIQTDNEDQPTFSFSDLAAYESCPFGYRLSSLLGFQPQLAAELGYGKAIHHILRRLADLVRQKRALPSEREIHSLFHEEFYLPFANQFAYEKLHAAANTLVSRYLNAYSEDLFRVWVTERPFELHLDNGIVTGRADVVLDGEDGQPGSMAIVDYKTSTNTDTAAYQFQLAIYAAAGRSEGINVRAAYVHDLAKGARAAIPVGDSEARAARERAQMALSDIANRRFPAKVGRHCGTCDVRHVCQHGPAR